MVYQCEEEKRFQLGGTEYHLSADAVAQAMRDVQPKPLGKYFVLINGAAFPPKQVIDQSLGKDLVKFTTMDAARILTALGLEVQRVAERRPPSKNKSELLFEQYLGMSGLSDYEFEKEFPGRSQRPDHAAKLANETEILFEVKEFRTTMDDFLPGGEEHTTPMRSSGKKSIKAGRNSKRLKTTAAASFCLTEISPLWTSLGK